MSLIAVFLTIYDILYAIYEIEIAALAFGKLAMKKMDSYFHENDIKNRLVG